MLAYREQMGAKLWNSSDNSGQVIVQHTTETESGNSSVIAYLEETQRGSYQTMIDFDGEEVRIVPDDRQAWAAGTTGNAIGLHVCAMGRAAFSRERWLSESDLIERHAMRYSQWHMLYGIPLVKINATQVRNGVRGVCGHVEISNAFGEVDHTDPGPNWPYDVVIGRAIELVNGATPMAWKSVIDGKTYSDDDWKSFVDYHLWRLDKLNTQAASHAGLDTSDAALKKL